MISRGIHNMARTGKKEKIRIRYYECNMTKSQHLLAYFFFAVGIGMVLFIYYRVFVVSVAGGLLLAGFQEKNYAGSVMRKRQSRLRMQFKEFLEIVSVSVSGGSGRSIENAIIDSLHELRLIFHQDADIVREIALIVDEYERTGIPMAEGFAELGERSEIDDIVSFATVYKTMAGKTGEYGYIIAQTRDIIKDKAEIIMEIETGITAAKSEAYMMLILPLVLVILMSVIGSGFLDALFTTAAGRISATVGVVCTFASYVIAVRATEISI